MLIFSCAGNQENKDSTEITGVSFAEKFSIKGDSITILEPFPGAKTPISYYFTKSPERVIVTSTTHLPYLEMLELEEYLVGFPGVSYINSNKFRRKVKNNDIVDLGPDGNINLELVYELQPDLVIVFDMGNESRYLDKLQEANIPVLYNSDFLESNALGRAEWIKVFGKIFNKEQKADSIFNSISNRYNELKSLASTAKSNPTVFSGVLLGDIWYLPGGKNWAAEFFKDAGANYLWSDSEDNGWLELSFETVFTKAANADFWIGVSNFKSKENLANQDSRYTEFNAFETENIYNYSKRVNEAGGFDYFESGYARPDLILGDLIHIFHPELLPDHQSYYYEKLK